MKQSAHDARSVHLAVSDDGGAVEFFRDGNLIYYIEFSQCRTLTTALDWIRQISEKSWATMQTISTLCTLLIDKNGWRAK